MNLNFENFLFELYRQTIDPIIFVDMQGLIIWLNPSAEHYFGYAKNELVGREIEILVPDALKSGHRVLREKYQKHPVSRPMASGLKLQGQHKNGSVLDIEISLCPVTITTGQTAVAALIRDVHVSRIYEEKLINMYNHDPLTGLMTITYLHSKLHKVIVDGENSGTMFAFCVIDIDDFKYFNDTYGHDVGNKILQFVAQRLKKLSRKIDLVVRLGGDEFIILLRGFKDKVNIKMAVKKIHHAVTQSYHIDNKLFNVPVSMGVSIFPDDAKTAELLFKKADLAMYTVKNSGKNSYAFSSSLNPTMTDLPTNKVNVWNISKDLELDPLTGFLNFRAFRTHLNEIVAQRSLMANYLFLIGIDNFKAINNIVGYETADQLLVLFALRIKDFIKDEPCVLARKSGDEFIILLSQYSKKEIAEIAKQLLLTISKPFQIEMHSLYLTASIGISAYPEDDQDKVPLLTQADFALQQVKGLGKNNFKFYSMRAGLHAKRLQILQKDLPHALERKEFFLCYQLQYDIVNNQIVGAEALLRWRHSTLGLIYPKTFVPLMENTALINIIGDWVLTEACQQAKRWQTFIKDFQIAVNVSVSQLTPLFARDQYKITTSVQNALCKSGLSPQSLELEITEGFILSQALAQSNLQKLKKLNIRFACDDFGANFSSFNRLKDLPLSTIKIDQSLIDKIVNKPVEYLLVDSILKIAKKLKIRVVAEGVTQQEQIDILKKLGCQFVQGYFYSKPLTVKAFERLLFYR